MAEGTCALTGASGKLVRSHILPQALTRHSIPGEHFIQAGEGERPVRRWSSWYDLSLVTREGEDILARHDEQGIAVLRKHKLIWSSWGSDDSPTFDDLTPTSPAGHGVRIIKDVDGATLRLFFLSILWRAAASTLQEFKKITLRPGQMNRLREMVRTGDPKPQFLFPMNLVQLTTRGPHHNASPITAKKPLGMNKGTSHIRIFRFYLDGLLIHFHRDTDIKSWREMGDLTVGRSEQLGVITMPYEVSLECENVELVGAQAQKQWPHVFQRLTE
ncbi:MAG TPA: hypothetical protein VGB04_08990 [Allosphingosinicella sp.]|jgi:hypothetical protein